MKNLRFALAALIAFSVGGAAQAQDDWKFVIAPYLWASGLKGDVAVIGSPAAVDVSFSDIVDVLDGGGLLHFEANKGAWTLLADAVYLDLGQEFEVVPGEAEMTQGIYEFAAAVSIKDDLDWLFGVRYTDVDIELNFQVPLAMVTVTDSQSWVDPVIGIRWQPELGERWNAYLRGDVGGSPDGSDLTVQFRAGALYRPSELISLSFGYRLLDYDFEDGAGLQKFVYDVQMSGLEVGVGFNF